MKPRRHYAGRRSKVRPDLEIQSLAKRAKITPSYFGGILNGRKTPSLEVARRMASVLGLSGIDELQRKLTQWQKSSRKRPII